MKELTGFLTVKIREDTKTGVYVDSLTEEFVSNVDDVTRLLLKVEILWFPYRSCFRAVSIWIFCRMFMDERSLKMRSWWN